MSNALNIVWFKRDLRVADHLPLAMASRLGPVLPLYIVEPDFWAQPDASARQWAFVAESLEELRSDLEALGQPLCIMAGNAVSIFREIHQRHGIASIWSHEETGNGWTYARDLDVSAWAREQGVPWHEPRQFGVIRRLASRNGWANAWDSDMAEPVTSIPKALNPLAGDWPRTIPQFADLGLKPDPCHHRQRGGRAAALAMLESFLGERGRDYRFRMSSPVTAFDACSRLSPHLTWGTISMREVAQATVNRIRSIRHLGDPASKNWRASLISFMGRLHWHCHFMQKLEDEPRLEFENLHRSYDGVRPDVADQTKLDAWCTGQTGFPFIDACMRALDRHGWINFRMRAMLMSFASYDLWLPWRASGLHLARQFVDYEPGIHWSQVQMQSGTTGINTMRVYNPVKQGLDQDPAGAFIRRFVPELEVVPDAFIHEPWKWSDASSLRYPPPIVDHATAAKSAKNTLYALRKGSEHKEVASKIVTKHGSRKTGPSAAKRKLKAESEAVQGVQLTLDI